MRYLGNKDSILYEIEKLLERKNLLQKNYVLFDAFCGTGSVSRNFSDIYKIVINDNLLMPLTYSYGSLVANDCDFNELGFNPFKYFNESKEIVEGFFYNNYSPKKSGRMYFNDYNAGRIDFFRIKISEWYTDKKINVKEYNYLLACLLESVSKVSNVAGVYGAYLKTWDPRALKDIIFLQIENDKKCVHDVEKYNMNISKIIDKVDCDILYLDPPYTKNKYSVQYHILETLIRYDNPTLKGITGTRDMSWVSQTWSTKNAVEVEFENTVAKTKAKHVILSYSSDGLMTKEYILNVLRRHCEKDSVECIEIPYKKYRNYKTYKDNEHYEYLFYGKKLLSNQVSYYCPLNYMGGKTNIIDYIKPHLEGKPVLIDAMGGGFNVGINGYGFEKIIYNDINHIVRDILLMFKNESTKNILDKIEKIIKQYSLEKHNKENYINYRNDYNAKYRYKDDYTIYLYTLILYGFQQQLRFNSSLEFNNPIGESGYNDSIKEKIVSFSRRIKELNVEFYNKNYYDLKDLIDNSVVYLDPPYLITLGSYNDGKRGFNGWNELEEQKFIDFLDYLKKCNCKIVVSNIVEYKGRKNEYLAKWINANKPLVKNIVIRGREEVLIIYETDL